MGDGQGGHLKVRFEPALSGEVVERVNKRLLLAAGDVGLFAKWYAEDVGEVMGTPALGPGGFVRVDAGDFARIVQEAERARAREQELLEANTRLVEERREAVSNARKGG